MQQLSSLEILHFLNFKVYVIEPQIGLVVRALLFALLDYFFELNALN